jgi:hypothetical protein
MDYINNIIQEAINDYVNNIINEEVINEISKKEKQEKKIPRIN